MNLLFALGALIASYLIQAMLTSKPEVPKPASLNDFDFPQISENTPQSVVFGDVWIEDWMVLWYGNLRTSPVKAEQGKK